MRKDRERGAVMVEFALIVPLLLLLVLGLVEFGYRYQRAAMLNNAAFVGARDFSVHGDYDGAKAAAEEVNNGGAIPGFTVNPGTCTSGANVTVTFGFTENSPTGFFGSGTFVINAKGAARCEG